MGSCSTSLHNPEFRNPATSFHFLAPFTHPTSAALLSGTSFPFVSFTSSRSLAPSPLHSASPLGALSPRSTIPVTATPRPPLHRGHGHRATPLTSLGPGRHGPRVKHLLLPRRDCLPNRLPPRDRPGRNASPQDLESITVRLPSGIGHGKGPCSAQADLVSP